MNKLTHTEKLVLGFIRQNHRHVNFKENLGCALREMCENFTAFPGTTRERIIRNAYAKAGLFFTLYLSHLPETKRPWWQMKLVALMLQSAHLYESCKEDHFAYGQKLIENTPELVTA